MFLSGGEALRSGPIRSFDVATGQQVAESVPLLLYGSSPNRFELDESRGILIAPHFEIFGPLLYRWHVFAFDASSLALLGEGNPNGYGYFHNFQPLKGRGSAGAYVVMSPPPNSGVCWTWVDALGGTGVVRAHVEVSTLAGLEPTTGWVTCSAAAVMLSAPNAPMLTQAVAAHRVVLTWTNPGDTSEFQLEVGLASGRKDVTIPLGFATTAVFNGVPSGVYYASVRAINEIGSSPRSSEVVIVVPP